jgi:hypothetical protein
VKQLVPTLTLIIIALALVASLAGALSSSNQVYRTVTTARGDASKSPMQGCTGTVCSRSPVERCGMSCGRAWPFLSSQLWRSWRRFSSTSVTDRPDPVVADHRDAA